MKKSSESCCPGEGKSKRFCRKFHSLEIVVVNWKSLGAGATSFNTISVISLLRRIFFCNLRLCEEPPLCYLIKHSHSWLPSTEMSSMLSKTVSINWMQLYSQQVWESKFLKVLSFASLSKFFSRTSLSLASVDFLFHGFIFFSSFFFFGMVSSAVAFLFKPLLVSLVKSKVFFELQW